MTVLITLSGVGSSAGPLFDLYASPDGINFTVFLSGVNKTVLEAGYTATVPDGTTDIKVTSVGQCTNSYVATIGVIPTTTTTTTTANLYLCALNDVTIGSQIWTACNLNVETYRDGTEIPQFTGTNEDWAALTTGAWCYYRNNIEYDGYVYGKLYNWYAVVGIWNEASLIDPLLRKNIAPANYHMPSSTEWTTLTNFLGGNPGGDLKETGLNHWWYPNSDANNSFGFTALPGGLRDPLAGFANKGNFGQWWTSSDDNSFGQDYGIYRIMTYNDSDITLSSNYKTNGMSVRLIKD
jgi:uncharacterized protein (TIGR02145 family)